MSAKEPASRTAVGLRWSQWKIEAGAIGLLGLMVVCFLAMSWRKWPDPLIDGYQWYTAWQISEGAMLYKDLSLAYGPLSSYFNALLFKCFGPGMMVIIGANLLIYATILALIYITFRIAWGVLGAFMASAVFISVFSFSQLIRCGNFNFAAPYSHEIIHGLLIILIAVILAAKWSRKPSASLAFAIGLCGGLAMVLKPEFMLAGGMLGIAALVLRKLQHQPIRFQEIALVVAGLLLPTLAFASHFAREMPWSTAFVQASHAWVFVLIGNVFGGFQQNVIGVDNAMENSLYGIGATAAAILVLGCIWLVGRAFSRPGSSAKRFGAVVLAIAAIYVASLNGGWIQVGLCLPGLTGIFFIYLLVRLRREIKNHEISDRTAMSLLLVLFAGAMLARMVLRARVYDFGFYQAAFAGLVVAAVLAVEFPRLAKLNPVGTRIVRLSVIALIVWGCSSIAWKSCQIRFTQTQAVGTGLDKFYTFNSKIDATGELEDWVLNQLESTPSDSTLLVMPEGPLINYLSRRKFPLDHWTSILGGYTEKEADDIITQLSQTPPDYVVFISRPMLEHGVTQFAAPGTPGNKTYRWIQENYQAISSKGFPPFESNKRKGAIILRRNAEIIPVK